MNNAIVILTHCFSKDKNKNGVGGGQTNRLLQTYKYEKAPMYPLNSQKVLSIIRSVALLLCMVVVLAFVGSGQVSAQTHIVVDRDTGEVLSHHRANRRWAPASLTKVMTTYVALKAVKLQQLKMNSPVGVSPHALSQPPTKMGFPVGTILTLENAIKLILVKSANDVSVAIAESVGGDEETFVRLMNAHSRRLGMNDTLYQNPNGLPHPLQYSSSADQARLAIAVRNEFPEYAYLFGVEALKVGRRTLRNFNRLLTRFEGTDGMKTGFVCASGYNVIVTAKRRNRNLVAVVLGERSGRRRNIKAAEVLATAPRKKADDAFPQLADLTRVVDRHAGKFDLHAPEDIAHLVCRRKYRPAVTAASEIEKQWDREVVAAKKEEIRRLKAIRIAEQKEARIGEIASKKSEETQTLALVKTDGEPVASAALAIEALTSVKKLPVPVVNPNKRKTTKKVARKKTGKKKTSKKKVLAKNKGPSIRDLEKRYFLQKVGPLEVQLVRLGQAFGPNPHGIPVLNGAAYPKSIPVPGSRPELICKVDDGAEELPEIEVKPFEKPDWDCLPVPLLRSVGLAAVSKEPQQKTQPAVGETTAGEGDKG